MSQNPFKDIEKFETDLWEAADNLRANSKLTSSNYFMPVLGIIFLRYAANRFTVAKKQIEADQATGRMPDRPLLDADYIRRRALPLPECASYDWIMENASNSDLPTLVTEAMKAIEEKFQPLKGVLPKDYSIFEPKVLEDLMRLFNSEQIKQATGDVFGRIYEYFLANFSMQKAHDNGEFFTPFSLVQTIVNVIEPDHGIVFDPACGSGGMFVQSSHFIEYKGGDTAHKVVFYGQEKNPDTIRIAKINLAVHGLTGEIAEAITYYEDKHNLVGKCDFVMANPPFNVDLVDAERIAKDPRLPFDLPGVNKQKKVSNGNYLWISYFWSYLNEKGRAGFVMSSQASSAGHGEKEVRRRIIQTGDVDVMISIRSNFFYTRTVPCELWFFDRGKPVDRRDFILMIDARNVFRKVNRKINDFTPEQHANLSSIVWLYRGQRDRFLALVQRYLVRIGEESASIPKKIAAYEAKFATVYGWLECFATELGKIDTLEAGKKQFVIDAVWELGETNSLYKADRKSLLAEVENFRKGLDTSTPATTEPQHATRQAFLPIAERIKGLIKQVDLLYKLADRANSFAGELFSELPEEIRAHYDRREVGKQLKHLDAERKATVEQLREAVYFYQQAVWLLDRFPDAELVTVPGLVRLVSRAEIEAADWSLTPGRYVGMAPTEEDDEFDFEQVLRDIHTELADLNQEATILAAKIQQNIEGLL